MSMLKVRQYLSYHDFARDDGAVIGAGHGDIGALGMLCCQSDAAHRVDVDRSGVLCRKTGRFP